MKDALIKAIAFIPITAKARGRLYQYIYARQYDNNIGKDFSIGYGSYIQSEKIYINDNCHIGNLVRIKFLDKFELGHHVKVGSSTIICGSHAENKSGERNFQCGNDVEILCSHYFDIAAPIEIGNDVTIGGKWTQFYTHSYDLEGDRIDKKIQVGNHIYIGAGCIINLGVNICDEVVLQSGTVVNKDITESGVYTSNNFVKRGEVKKYNKLFDKRFLVQTADGDKVYRF